jgi:hypothetical protein
MLIIILANVVSGPIWELSKVLHDNMLCCEIVYTKVVDNSCIYLLLRFGVIWLSSL